MQEFSFSNDILGKHLDRAIINKMQFSHSLHPIEVFPERKWQHLHPTKVKHYHSFGYEICKKLAFETIIIKHFSFSSGHSEVRIGCYLQIGDIKSLSV